MQTRLQVATAAGIAAGAAILAVDPVTVETHVKTTAGDLVTAADLASEETIIQHLKTAYPDDLIIAEETPSGQELLKPAELPSLTAWIIDPLDGTNNFKHGIAYSGISIGFVENGEPALGVIYDPYCQKLYAASKGQGATCNGWPISVARVTALDAGTRVCTSNAAHEGGTQANLERYAQLGHVWVDVLGSAVLIMADVASGRLDLYHHNGLKPWDNAAGFLIAREAGAKITDLSGQPTNWLTNEVVIGNPSLVDAFLAKLHEA